MQYTRYLQTFPYSMYLVLQLYEQMYNAYFCNFDDSKTNFPLKLIFGIGLTILGGFSCVDFGGMIPPTLTSVSLELPVADAFQSIVAIMNSYYTYNFGV